MVKDCELEKIMELVKKEGFDIKDIDDLELIDEGNYDRGVEDEFILLKYKNHYFIAKYCVGVYGWHHVFVFEDIRDARKKFNDLISDDDDLADYYLSLQ